MNREEAKHKLDYMKKAYQKLIDEKVDSGKLVGDGVRGEWKAETPLDEAYKSMIDALEIAIKALQQEPCENCCNGNQIEKAKLCQKSYLAGMEHKQEPCGDCISRQAVLEVIRKCHCEEWVKADIGAPIDALPSVTPQQKMGHWEWVQYDSNPNIGNWHCSECRTIIPHMPEETDNTPIYKWCPMCGAKMQEVKE